MRSSRFSDLASGIVHLLNARSIVGPILPLAAFACGGLVVPSGSARVDASTSASGPRDAGIDRPFADAHAVTFDASGLLTCAACVGVACEDLFVQCEQSVECYAGLQCAAASDASSAPCRCADPDAGQGPLLALVRCEQAAECGGECAVACARDGGGGAGRASCTDRPPAACGTSPVSSTARCSACVTASCREFEAACGEGSDCQDYLACLAACAGAGCLESCGTAHATGQGAADELDVCLGGNCQSECAF